MYIYGAVLSKVTYLPTTTLRPPNKMLNINYKNKTDGHIATALPLPISPLS